MDIFDNTRKGEAYNGYQYTVKSNQVICTLLPTKTANLNAFLYQIGIEFKYRIGERGIRLIGRNLSSAANCVLNEKTSG